MLKIRLPLLLAGTMALVFASPALAAPGGEWTLISTENIRYFLPGNAAPQNAVPATGTDAAALAQPTTPDPRQWILVETKQISEFIPDAETNAQVIATQVERTTTETHTVTDPPLAKDYFKTPFVQTRVQFGPASAPDASGRVNFTQQVLQTRIKPYKRKIQTHIDTAVRTVTRETRRVDRTTRTSSGQEIVITRTWDALVETRNPPSGFKVNAPDPAMDRVEFGVDSESLPTLTKTIQMSPGASCATTGGSVRAYSSEKSSGTVRLGGSKTVAVQGVSAVKTSTSRKVSGSGGSTIRPNGNGK